MKTTVITEFNVTGFHAWPGAPDSVAYLRDMHRHQFFYYVAVQVNHLNREVEFHTLLRECLVIMSTYSNAENEFKFGPRSCEMLAVDMIEELVRLGYKVAWVEVWEDDECGARVEP